MIGSGTDEHWNNILRAVGRGELVGDPRYKDLSGRITNNDEVDAVITRVDGKAHRGGGAHGTAPLRRHLRTRPHHPGHPRLAAPEGAGHDRRPPPPRAGSPERRQDGRLPPQVQQNAQAATTPPLPGADEHNAEILGDMLGLSKEEIERLKEDGVI